MEPVSNDGNGTGNGDSPGLNPAWNEVLSTIPSDLHDQVVPHLRKWDQNVQSRIEEANRNLSSWEDYKPLQEHGVSMQTVAEALKLHYDLNTSPQEFYKNMGTQLGFGGTTDDGDEDENPLTAQQKKLQEQIDLISQVIINDKKSKEAADADAALNREIQQAVEKHDGLQLDPLAMKFVFAQMSDGKTSAQKAVDAFVGFRNSLTPSVPAPMILGGATGGVPSNAIDPTKLAPQDVRKLVAEIARRDAESD